MPKKSVEFLPQPGYLERRIIDVGKTLFDTEAQTAQVHQIEQKIANLTHPTTYLHIPFCRTHCNFCDFPTIILNTVLGKRYIDALDRQLSYLKRSYPALDMSKTYIGGGTPATLLSDLIGLVDKHNIGTDQLSIEAHPQDFSHITDPELSEMKRLFTRVSIGVQTFDPLVLQTMNRSNGQNPLDYIQRALDTQMIVNVDLIYGLEGQSLASFISDLERLIQIGVPQITCYPLMGKEINTFAEVAEHQFYSSLLDVFSRAGYKPVTPWCFTNNDKEDQGEYISQNNNDAREQILALGVGGISKISSYFAINHFNLKAYFEAAEQDRLPIMSTKKLSTFQEAHYFLLTGLFGMRVDTSQLTANPAINTLIKLELSVLEIAGVVRRKKENAHVYELTEQGMFYLSKAMSSFYAGLGRFRRPHNQTILTDTDFREGAEIFSV